MNTYAAWIKSYAYGAALPASAGNRIRAVTYELIEAAHLNTLVVDCPKKSDVRDELGHFRVFFDECKRRGWPVHLWFYNRTDFLDAAKRQAQVDNIMYWLNEFPDVNGVHLDSIRFDETKRGGHPYRDPVRAGAVTQTVQMIHDAVKAFNPDLCLSAAVKVISSAGQRSGGPFTNWERDWPYHKMAQQDALDWLRDGLLDVAYPMNYQGDTDDWVFEAEQWNVEGMGNRAVIGLPWKFEGQERPEHLSEKIAKAQATGVKNFAVFAFNNYFGDEPEADRFRRDLEMAAHLGSTVFTLEPDPLPEIVPDWAGIAEQLTAIADATAQLATLCEALVPTE